MVDGRSFSICYSLCVHRALPVLAACLLSLALVRGANPADAPVFTASKDYPLASGINSWASVMADVLMNREGGVDEAKSMMKNFQGLVQAHLVKMQKDFQAGKAFPELPIIHDLKAFQGGLDLQPSNVTALSLSSAFVNYAPCLISNDMVGAAATAVGINIVPQVVNIAVKGASILPIGVNINPAVILVNPQGAAIWPRGVNIQPTLIAIAPAGKVVSPKGVQVAPYGIAVTGK